MQVQNAQQTTSAIVTSHSRRSYASGAATLAAVLTYICFASFFLWAIFFTTIAWILACAVSPILQSQFHSIDGLKFIFSFLHALRLIIIMMSESISVPKDAKFVPILGQLWPLLQHSLYLVVWLVELYCGYASTTIELHD